MNVSTNATSIVHEAEFQRQHIRLRIPLKIQMGETTYRTANWSVGGFLLTGFSRSPNVGETFDCRLLLDFGGFELAVPVRAEVRRIAPAPGTASRAETNVSVGFRFVDVSSQQTSVLRFLVDAYLSGEIVQVDDLFDVMARNHMVPARKQPPAPERLEGLRRVSHWGKRVATIAFVATAAFGLAAFVGSSVFQAAYVLESQQGVVAASWTEVRAPSSGVLAFVGASPGEEVTIGEPLLGVRERGGEITYIDSPCDCAVQEQLVVERAFVVAGETVITLAEAGTEPFVSARLALDDARELGTTDRAVVRIVGHDTTLHGSIVSTTLSPDGLWVEVHVEPDDAIPLDLLGRPAYVLVNTFASSGAGMTLTRLGSALRGLGREDSPPTEISAR